MRDASGFLQYFVRSGGSFRVLEGRTVFPTGSAIVPPRVHEVLLRKVGNG